MMFTARMKYLVAVVLDKHVDAVTRELLSLGLLHFVKIQELQAGLENKVASVALTVSTTRLQEIRKRLESFLSIIKSYPEAQKNVDLGRLTPVDLDASEKSLNVIAAEVQAFRERQKSIQQEILKLEDIRRQVLLFGDLRATLKAGSQYSFLNFQAGTVAADRADDFKREIEAFPSVVLAFHEEESSVSLLVISMKRDEEQIRLILEKHAFQEAEVIPEMLGVKEEVTAAIDRKVGALSAEQESLHARSQAVIGDKREALLDLWENLRLNELYYRIQSYFSRTARTILFSGWVPADRQADIEGSLRRITDDGCYLEWQDPAGLEKETHKRVAVPVQLKHSKLLSPFQMLVINFSIPQYGTIDPTPVIAIVYLVMFGLMFNDVGQGAVMFIAGLLGWLFGRRLKRGARELVKLVAFCGAAATAGGFLTGEFFGFHGIVPALVADLPALIQPGGEAPIRSPVTSILQVLVLTLYLGIGVIALGIVLNWINCIRSKQWAKLVFDRTGLVGGWMYGGAVYTGYYFVASDFKGLPSETGLLLALGLPALLLLGKPVVEFFEHRSRHPEVSFSAVTPVRFFFEWIIELLEFFAGYLSNTLSFLRVAGLGIAHAALMMAFHSMGEMIAGGAGRPFTFMSYVVMAVGNLFVIALEGLSAGIQSLRLNYYEFFSKYFRGSGEAYRPVSLREP